METRFSALLDGELGDQDCASTLNTLRQDAAARDEFGMYCLIGDTLRGEGRLGTEMTASVMARLAAEPTVLAPHRSRKPQRGLWRPAMALAASAAGVALVAWLALVPQPNDVSPLLAKAPVAKEVVSVQQGSPQASMTLASSREMQEYLIAHQAHTANYHLSAGPQQIRTISFVETGAGK